MFSQVVQEGRYILYNDVASIFLFVVCINATFLISTTGVTTLFRGSKIKYFL
ncbi:unnamed protein product, partial [Gadus morhua 'NCC']